jgi:uncharacterized protein YndB with AHSA1/START domain
MERVLPGPIERVWSYLTSPEHLAKWFLDGKVADRIGGEVQFGDGLITGAVTVYDPPHVLEFTWNEADSSHGPTPNALCRYELSAIGDEVRLVLVHSRLPEHAYDAYVTGWKELLDRLEVESCQR